MTGLLEEFMGMPDTPENRAKFKASVPLGRFSMCDRFTLCRWNASSTSTSSRGDSRLDSCRSSSSITKPL